MTPPPPATSLDAYGLDELVRDIECLLDRRPSVPVTIKEVSRLVARLLGADGAWLRPEFRQPIADSYARYMLHRDRQNRFVVLALVWLPGQSTPVHDHSCWGVMGLMEGELEEVLYDRLDDGARAGYAELQERLARRVAAGSVSYVLPPYDEIHRIGNAGPGQALSVHVYGRDLDELNVFEPLSRRVSRMRIKYYNPVSSAFDFII